MADIRLSSGTVVDQRLVSGEGFEGTPVAGIVSGYGGMRLTGLTCSDCGAPIGFRPRTHSYCAYCAYKPENRVKWQ